MCEIIIQFNTIQKIDALNKIAGWMAIWLIINSLGIIIDILINKGGVTMVQITRDTTIGELIFKSS